MPPEDPTPPEGDERSLVLQAALCMVAATALSLATWQSRGTGSPLAFKWLMLAVFAGFSALLASQATLSEQVRRLPMHGVLLACIGAQFAALVWSPLDAPLGEMGSHGIRAMMMMVGVAAVISGLLITAKSTMSRWAFPLLLVLHFAIGLLILQKLPVPGIDVIMFQRGACKALLEGLNPYAIRFLDPYPPASSALFYGPGISVNGILQIGFPYMPLSFLLDLPAYLLGDIRYASLICTTAAGALIGYATPSRNAKPAAAMLLFSPIWPLVLFLGWTEPHVILMLALTWFCHHRYPRLMPVAFGLLMASKQYMPLAAPLGLLLLPRPWSIRQTVAFGSKALFAASAITLPFVFWNLPEFINSAVLCQIRQPYRTDALSFLSWAAPTNPAKWLWLPFAEFALTILICLACALRRRISFPLALSLCLLAFFSTNKQAFANYYYLVIGALLCGVCGLAAGNEVGGVAAPVQHNLDPPVGRAGR